MTFEERSYRSYVRDSRLVSFRVVVQETDLWVRATTALEREATDLILKHRMPLERYARDCPGFIEAVEPVAEDSLAPPIVKTMIDAGRQAGVGPMAAVAGAIAEYVGRDLLDYSDEVVIENGGDIFLSMTDPATIAILAGSSPLSNRLGLRTDFPQGSVGVCTSSGTVGHSLSLGAADAVVVLSESTALADAVATALGNKVADGADIDAAIAAGKAINGVLGLVIIVGVQLGVWGQVELVQL